MKETSTLEPIERLTKDLRVAAEEMSVEEARYLVDIFYAMQGQRIRTAAQIRALGDSQEPHGIFKWFFDQSKALEHQVQAGLKRFASKQPLGEWAMSVCGVGPVIASGLLSHIDCTVPTAGHVWNFAGLNPGMVWIGAKAAKLVGAIVDTNRDVTNDEFIDIAKRLGACPKWLSRSAYHITTGNYVQFRNLDQLSEKEYVEVTLMGVQVKRKAIIDAVAKRPWNTKLKTLAVFKLGESFVKVQNNDNDVYGTLYAQRKKNYWRMNVSRQFKDAAYAGTKRVGKTTEAFKWYSGKYQGVDLAANPIKGVLATNGNGRAMLPPAHIHSRARRVAVKIFLCYSRDTLLWTKDGPKSVTKISANDSLATMTSDGALEYHKPTALHQYPFDGEMVHFQGANYDFLVTPNHQMVVRRKGKDQWRFMKAKYLLTRSSPRLEQHESVLEMVGTGTSRKAAAEFAGVTHEQVHKWIGRGQKPGGTTPINYEFKCDAQWVGRDQSTLDGFPIKPYLEYLGWFLSEGHTYKSPKHSGSYVVGITQKDVRVLQWLKVIATQMGFPNGKIYNATTPQLIISSKKLFGHFSRFGKSHQKYIPENVKSLPTNRLQLVMNGMLSGDGTVGPTSIRYPTVSSQLAYDFSEIALKCGYGFKIRTVPEREAMVRGKSCIARPTYIVSLVKSRSTPEINEPKPSPYKDDVFCVTVPNHTVLAGRNGRYAWCGNSHYHAIGHYIETGNLPPRPYAMEHMGHAHLIDPPNMDLVDGFAKAWAKQ